MGISKSGSTQIEIDVQLHPYTVRRLAREKKIPAFRVGGQWRFRRDDIDKWSRAYPFVDKKGT